MCVVVNSCCFFVSVFGLQVGGFTIFAIKGVKLPIRGVNHPYKARHHYDYLMYRRGCISIFVAPVTEKDAKLRKSHLA